MASLDTKRIVSDVATQYSLNKDKSNKNGGKEQKKEKEKKKKYGAQRTVQNPVATPLH